MAVRRTAFVLRWRGVGDAVAWVAWTRWSAKAVAAVGVEDAERVEVAEGEEGAGAAAAVPGGVDENVGVADGAGVREAVLPFRKTPRRPWVTQWAGGWVERE